MQEKTKIIKQFFSKGEIFSNGNIFNDLINFQIIV